MQRVAAGCNEMHNGTAKAAGYNGRQQEAVGCSEGQQVKREAAACNGWQQDATDGSRMQREAAKGNCPLRLCECIEVRRKKTKVTNNYKRIGS